MRVLRRRIAAIMSATLVLAVLGVAGFAPTASAATPPTLSLRVLLIGEGPSDPTTAAWQSALSSEGVPYTLATASGGTVTLPALSSGNSGNFNGVVIADSPTDYAAGALSALYAYESTFGVRQIDGYMFPLPALGVTDVTVGALDGTTATVTAAGLSAFPELKGPVPMDIGTFGYGATVNSGAPYTSFVNDSAGHTMAGVYQHPSGDPQAGVSELALTFNYNANSLQWLLLGAGLINWVTQNTHLGLYRNYFGQDIDDVFIADNEWSSTFQCTPGATEPPDYTCPAGVANNPADTPPDTLMSAADVAYLVNWQKTSGIRLNLAFNAVGACTGPTAAAASTAVCTGNLGAYTDPGYAVDATAPNSSALVNALLGSKAEFNWIMHTWSHAFLGCVVWQQQPLSSVTAGSGGSLAAGGYTYQISAATAYGESEPSVPQTVTVGANGSAVLTWPAATNGVGDTGNSGPTLLEEQASHTGGTGFWGYDVYRAPVGTTAFGLVGQVPVSSAATYSFTDTGAAAGAAPGSEVAFPTATNPGIDCASGAGSWDPANSTDVNTIQQQIGLDQAFAAANGLTSLPTDQYTQSAIVTGEHSGVENPNMPTALTALGITTFAQDASRQPQQYQLGSALGAPRYPSNIYYNASNWTDQLNEYNTLYVTQGVALPGGGTGHCTNTSSTTCRATPATKADFLASESHIMLTHVLANNPRMGYAHQPNLIGPTSDDGYTILGLIDNMLAQYNAWFTDPVTQITDVTSAQNLVKQSAWTAAEAGGQVSATETNGVVTISNSATAVNVPVTVPAGTTVNSAPFGQAYGGQLSDWVSVGSAPVVLTEHVAPTITSSAAATSIVGAPFSFTVATTGAPTPVITETGALPSGLTFTDNGNGTAEISGTPATGSGGSYPITISAANGVGTPPTQTFTLTNAEAPSITSATTATFVVGTPNTYTVTTTGYPAATITESGTLPAGLAFTANTDGTATISGTATGPAGTFPVTISATNISGSTATLSLTITVNASAPPKITSANSAFFTLGQAGAVAVTTSGAPIPVISETGALPAGLTFTDNQNGTALISGTPTATGTTPITVTATNSGGTDTQAFTFIVGQAPAFTSPASAAFTSGTASSFSVTTSGYPAPAIGQSGLPSDLSFLDNGNGTATISGTPSAADAGPHTVTLTAVNGTGTVSQSFTLTVAAAAAAPVITSAASVTFAASQAGTFTVTTTGNPVSALAQNGALPNGVTFTDNHNGTATLAGTPAAGTQGTYPLSITATNGVTPSASQTLTLTVNSGLAITSAGSATATGGTAFSFTVTTSGTPTPTLTRSGTLPGGITFTANANGTATLAGTPGATATGVYPLTFTARNTTGTASQGFTLTISQKPAFSSAATATETAGTAFSLAVNATGYPAPAVAAGTLPAGVTFTTGTSGTGTITGTTAVAAGTYTLALTATNVAGIASQAFALTVKAKAAGTVPVFTSAATATATPGKAFSFTITTAATAGTTNVTRVGALPGGVSFSNNGNGTAILSGTPNANTGGSYAITFTAKNTSGSTTQSFVLTVTGPPTITSAATVTATVGSSFNFTIRTTGAPVPTITQTGTLPSGVTFTNNGDGTATLSGTPTSTSGAFPLKLTATNTGGAVTQNFTMTVNQAPAITSNATATATPLGATFTFTFTASGFPLPNITRTGTLPRGLSYSNNGNGTATLTGKPTAAGTYPLTITARNTLGTATQAFTLTVR